MILGTTQLPITRQIQCYGQSHVKGSSAIQLAHHDSLTNMRCRFNIKVHIFVEIVEIIYFDRGNL